MARRSSNTESEAVLSSTTTATISLVADSNDVLALMQQLNREQGQTFVIVTHDPQVGELCGRIVQMKDGEIEEREVRSEE